MDPYIVPPLNIPVIPAFPVEPPTRGMSPPVTRGMTPPTAELPGYDAPTINLPPPTVTNPDPGKPRPGSQQEGGGGSQEEQQEEDTREMPADTPELPMAPFDASTEITIGIPIIEQEVTIPVPKPEVVITAGTTAAVATIGATGAAVFAKPMFDQVMKVVKPIVKKIIQKILKKKEKVYPKSVPLEHTLPDQFLFEGSRLSPLLARQHRDRRKEKKGAKTPPSESTQNTSEP